MSSSRNIRNRAAPLPTIRPVRAIFSPFPASPSAREGHRSLDPSSGPAMAGRGGGGGHGRHAALPISTFSPSSLSADAQACGWSRFVTPEEFKSYETITRTRASCLCPPGRWLRARLSCGFGFARGCARLATRSSRGFRVRSDANRTQDVPYGWWDASDCRGDPNAILLLVRGRAHSQARASGQQGIVAADLVRRLQGFREQFHKPA